MADPTPAIVLFREDLRLSDHPALMAACTSGRPIVCLYVHNVDPPWQSGAARLWWLHHSLSALNTSLKKLGGQLILRSGDVEQELARVLTETGATEVHWTRRYAPHQVASDTALKAFLRSHGYKAESHSGRLIHEPWTVRTKSGTPFRVFTPFWKTCQNGPGHDAPLTTPKTILFAKAPTSIPLDSLNLLPSKPNWANGFSQFWTPGEDGAKARLDQFIDSKADDYSGNRDIPSLDVTSGLSSHLQIGDISPRQMASAAKLAHTAGNIDYPQKFLAEIGWREFSYHLLFNNPGLLNEEFQPRFRAFPWRNPDSSFDAWCQGQTGYPMVDAGMRELWQTGIMHNRVRMITASFLVKHLLTDWRAGRDWFWDTLLDADIASNSASWQWVAGCGADAAPYFRIFNPITQGQKFDPKGAYIRRWVPELAQVPDKYLAQPWMAPPGVLSDAGIVLGQTYPKPIVDHKFARERALEAFKSI